MMTGGDGQPGALRQDAVGHLPGLPRGAADHPLGRQPIRIGHPSSSPTCARRRSAAPSSSLIDPRTTPLATLRRRPSRGEGRHRRRGRARDSSLSVHERPRRRGVPARSHHRRRHAIRERAEPWTIEKAADIAGVEPVGAGEVFAELYAQSSPALIRCGWGLERNRNGGNAAMAVLALPAVGGKFGVRGGGYSMSNSASWNIERTVDRHAGARHPPREHEPSRPRADRIRRSAGQRAVRLQLQSGRDRSGPAPRPPGPRARGSLHRRLRAGDDRHRAVRGRPAADTTFLEGYDFAKAYGPINLELRTTGDRCGRRGAHERRRLRRAVHAARVC